MPHRCMNCGKVYDEDAEELIEGCECGSSVFVFEKSEGEKKSEVEEDDVLKEVDDFLKKIKGSDDSELVIDPKSIEIEEEGVYSIDIKKLLDDEPIIVEVKDSRYYLHLASMFNKEGKLSRRDLEEAEKDD